MKPETSQNSTRLATTSALTRNRRAHHLSDRLRHDAGGGHPACGIAGDAAAELRHRRGANRRHPAEQACEITKLAAEVEQERRQRDPRPVLRAEGVAKVTDD